MKNPEKLNLILELIQSEYENEKLDLEQLKVIIELCKTFQAKEEVNVRRYDQYQGLYNNTKNIRNFQFYDMVDFKYPKVSEPFPENSPLPKEFMGEFKEEFPDSYEKTSRIFLNIAEKLFENNIDKISVYLAQTRSEIILCIKVKDEYYQINDVPELTKIDSNWINNFAASPGLGASLDEYLHNRRKDKLKNTRKFEITRNVFEYLKDKNYEAMILFPAICMDNDTNNPSKESYKYRYTYMISFGDETSDFNDLREAVIFDRNGLCPPPDDSNC